MDICLVIDSSSSVRDANPDDGSYDNWGLLIQFINAVNNLSFFVPFCIPKSFGPGDHDPVKDRGVTVGIVQQMI